MNADTAFTTFADEPDAFAGLEDADVGAFPEFLLHDEIWNACFPSFFELFGELQMVVRDAESGDVIGFANCIAIDWNGSAADLPAGTHDVLTRAIRERREGVQATTLVPIQAVVLPDRLGSGASRQLGDALREVAGRNGLARSITPLRPTDKARYPLAPMERYVTWTREDGLPLDPWLRAQVRLGAQILRVCHDSLVIEASVADWHEWTGLDFPESGDYVIDGGLVPLHVDRSADRGRYAEPHVWLRYS